MLKLSSWQFCTHWHSRPALADVSQLRTSLATAANALKGKFEAKGGVRPQQYAAVALEAVGHSHHTLHVLRSRLWQRGEVYLRGGADGCSLVAA